jgi:hypothetical protein
MPNVENLLSGDMDQFRKEVHDALYDKIKVQLHNKKQEIAADIYSDDSEECSECDNND